MAENDAPTQESAAAGEGQAPETQFSIQRVFLKDCSFESPRSPTVFQAEWKPQVTFDLKTRSSKIVDDAYEVVVQITAEAKLEDQTAFIVEVHEAGIFTLKGYEDEQMEVLLGSVCPNIVYPYARESIDSLIVKGTFPALMLAPINFDGLYQQQKQQAAQAAGNGQAGGEASPETTQ